VQWPKEKVQKTIKTMTKTKTKTKHYT